MTDAVWAMFYYTQLYICAFSFVGVLVATNCLLELIRPSKRMSSERQ